MSILRKITAIMLLLALAISIAVIPVSAASLDDSKSIVPTCPYCYSKRLQFIRTIYYYDNGVVIYSEREFLCKDCGRYCYYDSSLRSLSRGA